MMAGNQMVMGGHPGYQGAQTPSQKKIDQFNSKYKTERCRHFESHKNCLLKERCHFAHGDEELRKVGDILTPE